MNKNIIKKCRDVLYSIFGVFTNFVAAIYALIFLGIFLCFVPPFIVNPFRIDSADYYYNKAEIKDKFCRIINNGGGIEEIKNIYERYKGGLDFFTLYGPRTLSKDDYYPKDYSISDIFRDIITDSILNAKKDSIFYYKVNSIISENNRLNPFDKLEENQKNNFIHIQQVLDSADYVKISTDFSKIVDELSNKNQAVTRYLNLSETSYILAWVAIFMTLGLTVFQVILNIKLSNKNKKQLDEIEKMINKKE